MKLEISVTNTTTSMCYFTVLPRNNAVHPAVFQNKLYPYIRCLAKEAEKPRAQITKLKFSFTLFSSSSSPHIVGNLPKERWKGIGHSPPTPTHKMHSKSQHLPQESQLFHLSAHMDDCNPGGEAGRDLGLLRPHQRHLPQRPKPSQLFKLPAQELQWKTFRERKACKFLLKRQHHQCQRASTSSSGSICLSH